MEIFADLTHYLLRAEVAVSILFTRIVYKNLKCFGETLMNKQVATVMLSADS